MPALCTPFLTSLFGFGFRVLGHDSPKLTEKIWRWATEPLFFIYHDCYTVLKLPFESTSECQERQTRPHYLENPLTNNFRNLSSLKKLLRHKYTTFLTEDSISFRNISVARKMVTNTQLRVISFTRWYTYCKILR